MQFLHLLKQDIRIPVNVNFTSHSLIAGEDAVQEQNWGRITSPGANARKKSKGQSYSGLGTLTCIYH